MSRKNEIYLVLEEWKIIHKVGAKTVLNQLFYFGQNDSVCLGPGPCGIPENTGIPGFVSNTDTGIFENKIPVFFGIFV